MTIISLNTHLNWAREKLNPLVSGSLLQGGWEIKLSSAVKRSQENNITTCSLKEIKLTDNQGFDTRLRSRKREEFKLLRLRIVTLALNLLNERFAVDVWPKITNRK